MKNFIENKRKFYKNSFFKLKNQLSKHLKSIETVYFTNSYVHTNKNNKILKILKFIVNEFLLETQKD